LTIDGLWSVDEDGGGPAPAVLYASETFSNAGSVPTTALRRWDGRTWSVVSAGIDRPVLDLVPFGAGTLYAGGRFRSVGGQPSWYLASFHPCPLGCYANCDQSTTPPLLNINDFSCFLSLFAAGDLRANCDRSTAAPVLNVGDFVCFLNQFAAGCP
jgi:hypothetical protein